MGKVQRVLILNVVVHTVTAELLKVDDTMDFKTLMTFWFIATRQVLNKCVTIVLSGKTPYEGICSLLIQ